VTGEGRFRGAGVLGLGGPVVLLELPYPARLAEDDIQIAVRAAGVGNWDELARVGEWSLGRPTPFILGVEAAGVITAKGAAVQSFSVGDEVLVYSAEPHLQGSWAELMVAPAVYAAAKPAGVPWADAGAFPVPALTAHQALAAVGAPVGASGGSIFVHGAGGVTGGLIAQLARARGLQVSATAGGRSSPRVRAAGIQNLFDYADPAWPAAARRATPGGAGYPAAVNAVPGRAGLLATVVADGGHLATITGDPPQLGRGITVSNVYVQPDGPALRELAALLDAGQLIMPVATEHPLEEARDALFLVVSGRSGGTQVLRPNPTTA
jgi:NADPH:quinone reductase-like Zn-dependent oxidoreductase